MSTKLLSKADRIRILNDNLRKTFTGGRVVVTAHIAALIANRLQLWIWLRSE